MSSEAKDPQWMQNLWRPAMGWMYMVICLLDMAIFPVLWSLLQAMLHQPITQWDPLTLRGAGLFHIAMGAVLGIAAFGRTQEKLAGTAANPTHTVNTQNVNMTGNQAGGYGSGATNNFATPSFGAPAAPVYGATTPPAFTPAPAPNFGPKPLGPGRAPQPEL